VGRHHKRGRSDGGEVLDFLESWLRNGSDDVKPEEVEFFKKRSSEEQQSALVTSSSQEGIINEEALFKKCYGKSDKDLAKNLTIVINSIAGRDEASSSHFNTILRNAGCGEAEKAKRGNDEARRNLAAAGKKDELGRKLNTSQLSIAR